jgi:hypothetical protein
LKIVLLAVLVLAAASCATLRSPPCAGTPPTEIALSEPSGYSIGSLTCWATNDDKVSQFLLAQAYERGDGVLKDLDAARKWYAKSARPSTQTTYVYSPAVGKESYGRVIPITGRSAPGLPEAQRALARLKGVIAQR